MDDDDDDDPPEEDSRIATLYGAASKATPESFCALLEQLGTDGAVVYGNMCLDKPTARAHFIVMALIDLDDDSLPDCLEAAHDKLKATVEAGGAGAGIALCAAIEGLLCCPDSEAEGAAREAAVSGFDKALKVLWERSIVSEDELRGWQADERAGRHYRVPTADAQRLHDKGREFLEWVDAGEEA